MEKMVKPKLKSVCLNTSESAFLPETYDSEVDRLQSELKKMDTHLKRTKTISAQRLEEIKTLKESYSSELQNLSEQMQKSISDHENLLADYEKVIKEKTSLQNSLHKAASEICDLKKKADAFQNELVTTRKEFLAAREDLIHSQEILHRVESQKKSAEYDKIHFERETKRLRMEIDRMKMPPLLMGTVVKMIDSDHVVVRSSAGPQMVISAPSEMTAVQLAPGTNVALNQQTFSIAEILPILEEPEVSALELIEATDITYDQIGGLGDQLREIREVVELPLIKPEIFERIGIEPPKGALLFGPPGTGKTMIAKAVANKTKATFLRVVGSELVQKYIGDGSKMVHELFELAQKKAPSIIFIDEVDSIASRRTDDTTSADREIHRTLMQLLAEMDGFNRRSNVKIIAATNRLDILDPAILRPGRFDRMVYVPLPDKEGRETILKIHAAKMTLSDQVDFSELARRTDGASGADLKAIVTEAGMFAVREEKLSIEKIDFLNAIDKIMEAKKNDAFIPIPENMFS
ncbi:MAG: proteasome-activating nucleotidase [Methanimicrococcus sp.]|nr:proteasome-activating nucleotidase [Methanimicrococcus sp.]